MTDAETVAMLDAWIENTYPFDKAKCRFTIAEHVYGEAFYPRCGVPSHSQLRDKARKIKWYKDARVLEWLTKNYDRLVALRTEYKEFWSATP
jgi:hypothetical protein